MRGLPSGVNSSRCASSGSPSIHAAKPGEASRLLIAIASSSRSFAGKNVSRSNAPTLSNGGFCTAAISPAMSRLAPSRQACSSDVRQQDVLAALERIRIAPEQREQSRDERADAVPQRRGVVQHRSRAAPRTSAAPTAAGRCSSPACRWRRPPHRGSARCAPAPGPILPGPSSRSPPSAPRSSLDAHALARGFRRIDPRLESPPARDSETSAADCARSPFGSMQMAGMPSMAASSSSARHRPVLPLPVMPTHTACVVRSFES